MLRGGDVSVESLDEQLNSSNLAVLRFRINNEAPMPLHDVTVRYFAYENPYDSVVASVYYAPGVSVLKIAVNDTLSMLEFHADSVAPGVNPDSNGFSIGMHGASWIARDKLRDFSYVASDEFSENGRMVLYVGGELLFGEEPLDYIQSGTDSAGGYAEDFFGPLPDASPLVLQSGVTELLDDSDSVVFSWNPVAYATRYRLTVSDMDSVLLYQGDFVERTAKVWLPSGSYLWNVQAANGYSDFSGNVSEYNVMRKAAAPAAYADSACLGIESMHAQKDTRLLVTSYGEFADLRGWDRPRIWSMETLATTPPILDESDGKCWAIAVQELNRWRGGDLSLDEIVAVGHMRADSLKSENLRRGPSLAAFPLRNEAGGVDTLETQEAIKWALGIEPAWVRTLPSKNVIRNAIREDMPLYFNLKLQLDEVTSGHAMIADGFRETESGDFYIHFLNIDNYGTSVWIEYDDSLFVPGGVYPQTYTLMSYAILDVPETVRMTDSLVYRDSDGDGLMDFDEIYRFHTDPYNSDSDGDGITDKVEIHSYTIRQQTEIAGTDYTTEITTREKILTDTAMSKFGYFIVGLKDEPLADVDGDSLRAELDPDSDGDGISDGVEDRNHDGYVDAGETDPYVFDNPQLLSREEIPDTIALYSLDYLWMNDGFTCTKESTVSGCAVAAESKNGFSVILGAKANVENIFAKGQVWLRSNSTSGFIRYYGLPADSFTTKMQSGAMGKREYNSQSRLWPWRVYRKSGDPVSAVRDVVVRSGESRFLRDGDRIDFLKVESGGTLVLPAGTVTVNRLQLESGSWLDFAAPGYECVLRVNESVIWRAEYASFERKWFERGWVWPVRVGSADSVITVEKKRIKNIVKSFKLSYYGTEKLFIEGEWAGNLYAPNAKIVLGQTKHKTLYGQILGNGITVHQHSRLYFYRYKPESGIVVSMGGSR